MDETKNKIFELVKEYHSQRFSNQEKTESIPASQKVFDDKEMILAIDAVLDGWWTEGKVTEQFTKKFSDYLKTKHTIVLNSGSSANLLAIKALTSRKIGENRLKEGDEVITLAAGFPTTINPIVQCGCIPVFCDVDIGTYNVKIDDIENTINQKTKVIFLPHTLGNPFNVKAVKEICEQNNIWFVEDSCDALGSKYDGKYTGTFGDISTFSFYPAHHITMGEGGAICTNNDQINKIVRSMRDWGRDCWCGTGEDDTCKRRYNWKLGNLPEGYDHKYIYSEIGYNLKNTDLNVAIGLAQMDKLEEFTKIRERNFQLLSKELSEMSDLFYLPKKEQNSEPSWFGFPITVRENAGFTREEILKFLNKHKIGTRLLFAGNATKQPYFINNDIKYKVSNDLRNTDIIMKDTFWIGLHPNVTPEKIEYIKQIFIKFLQQDKQKV